MLEIPEHGSRGMTLGTIGVNPGWTSVGSELAGGGWWASDRLGYTPDDSQIGIS